VPLDCPDHQVFYYIDTDEDGEITPEQLQGIVERFGMRMSAAQLSAYVSEFDANSDGLINVTEFCNLMSKLHGRLGLTTNPILVAKDLQLTVRKLEQLVLTNTARTSQALSALVAGAKINAPSSLSESLATLASKAAPSTKPVAAAAAAAAGLVQAQLRGAPGRAGAGSAMAPAAISAASTPTTPTTPTMPTAAREHMERGAHHGAAGLVAMGAVPSLHASAHHGAVGLVAMGAGLTTAAHNGASDAQYGASCAAADGADPAFDPSEGLWACIAAANDAAKAAASGSAALGTAPLNRQSLLGTAPASESVSKGGGASGGAFGGAHARRGSGGGSGGGGASGGGRSRAGGSASPKRHGKSRPGKLPRHAHAHGAHGGGAHRSGTTPAPRLTSPGPDEVISLLVHPISVASNVGSDQRPSVLEEAPVTAPYLEAARRPSSGRRDGRPASRSPDRRGGGGGGGGGGGRGVVGGEGGGGGRSDLSGHSSATRTRSKSPRNLVC
jgi:hypothetical protein